MKFASLVFLLVPFVANAADLCVEDNILKCKELGYTESSCPYGGVACQYDTSLWYCAKWTCADGRLYSAENKPTNADCVETAYKNMTCYDCTAGQIAGCTNKNCAIGDVYYADGTCCPVENFDTNKIPVGVVYALSATKGGIPYTTAQAETKGFTSQHGRVINLRDLTSDSDTEEFDPENPYDNNHGSLCFGLYDTNVSGLTLYNSSNQPIYKDIQNNYAEIYSGKENTAKFANATSDYTPCNNGSYTKNTASYNQYCAPTAANASLSFYPPEVSKTHATVGAGNWYLPAIGELGLLSGVNVNEISEAFGSSAGYTGTTYIIVNNTLTTLKNKGINASAMDNEINASLPYLGSNQYTDIKITAFRFALGRDSGTSYGRYYHGKVRVSLEF